ncbi:MAG: flavodoxin-dependent (E)-4-hydroxy-3-methylbut-2-enyl-diphosphate synthase [Candidatus Dadabacteria bacterium]|nr:flavodoxin-dependent (E)-4-hydroxy-3-methylbut-2-enyl-diphosphate synthase [Candidatus Dadabacteria bacterium]MCH8014602.1 flavodoxin-dependent (E)-4-hydroxy-3-methylbut-2-enyl-diphosphate synthase [Candidatus Dadabacteria bacterium]MCZ6528485.1 flavodoxin-dependent (E)-4-hydroxy-3-methylbut-2-enyl-diphosphate synthase [Candidatus Dadabacteria bacterium]TDI92321.1 MAG: flavodoxin-dependent (E)-4-hydroxy-3-methylbut-2-enyl-diphosphate synthase [Candidatus Dadabacteria bacterium]TDJ02032.1 MAG
MERNTRQIELGGIKIGGGAPITVQSMTKTDTRDIPGTVAQIKSLEKAGCDIVRLAVPDMDAAKSLGEIKKQTNIPIISDIHFDYKLALEAVKQGVDGMRINPGNIGSKYRIKAVVDAVRERGIPIRIGVNSGSLEKDILKKHGSPTAEALAESAFRHVEILEDLDFRDIKISVKSTDVKKMIASYRILAERCEYPLHLGVTEAGTYEMGTIKSSIGIGTLLADGIGDTIRVSLTGDPVDEVIVGFNILRSLGLRRNGIELISCPGCGRLEIDLMKLVKDVEDRIADINLPRPIKVAILGCVVNGPGEASEADIGIAGGKGKGMLYKDGKLVRSFKEDQIVDELVKELKTFV